MKAEAERRSVVTCPVCGHQQVGAMPELSCVIQLQCAGCGRIMHPLSGDCCVFCSFGTVPCPVIQEARRASPALPGRMGCP